MISISSVVAFAVTVGVTIFILRSRFSRWIQDVPNERSLHSKVIPRTGGIGLLSGVLAGWMFSPGELAWWILAPLFGLFIVSVFDDVYNLPVKIRLLAHLTAAGIMVVGSGIVGQQGIIVSTILFFFVVWMTNLYNFMDGSDGLAGGMTLFGFGTYGVVAWFVQDMVVMSASLAITAAALGFLIFNFHPAKIFMGDAGSIPLGFLAAAMGIWGWQRGDWSYWLPLLVFSPFIADATVTLIRRSLRGVRVTDAHREHYYQRVIQMGVSHRRVALFEYGLMAGAASLAMWSRDQELPWQSLLLCTTTYAVSMLVIDRHWNKRVLS